MKSLKTQTKSGKLFSKDNPFESAVIFWASYVTIDKELIAASSTTPIEL